MRPRKEIEIQLNTMFPDKAGVVVELLLDIRDLLARDVLSDEEMLNLTSDYIVNGD